MSALNGNLTLTFVDAKDLNSEDLIAQDPYCKVSIGGGSEGIKEGLKSLLHIEGESWKTKTHKRGGRNPQWNESHTFALKDTKPDTMVNIHLMDEDIGPDDSIGVAKIAISELLENQTKGKHYYQLVEKSHKRRIAGYVGISAKFEGSGSSIHETKEGQQSSYIHTYPPQQGESSYIHTFPGSQQGYSQPQQGQQGGTQQSYLTPAFQSFGTYSSGPSSSAGPLPSPTPAFQSFSKDVNSDSQFTIAE